MTTTHAFTHPRSAARRLVALLGTIALCLGILALTPIAQASNGARQAATGAEGGTDESRATEKDFASGRVRTNPDTEKRGEEVKQAASPSQSTPKKGKEVPDAVAE